MLRGAPVDRVGEEVGADAAIVQKRIALTRCAITDDGPAAIFRVDQEGQQLAFGPLHLPAKALIGGKIVDTAPLLIV